MTEKLERHDHAHVEGPVVLIVLDGVGEGRKDDGDAVHLARTPTLERLERDAIRTDLLAHGTHVGMPSDGDMGNSEVGHNAIGSGKIYDQGAKLVDVAIRSGALFDPEDEASGTWLDVTGSIADGGTLHLIGLLSDGNVHSHIDHVLALCRDAATRGVTTIRLHVLLDGRDVGGQSALEYVDRVEELFGELEGDGVDARIASGGGRMLVTMDRYGAEWNMVETGWRAHVLGEGPEATSAREAIEAARAQNRDLNDQYIPPFVVHADGAPVGTIQDGDAVLLFNFRGDRAVELVQAFEADDFDHFDRVRRPDVFFAGMMRYDGDRGLPGRYLVGPSSIEGTMGERLACSGVRQLAISETQKFGHVTYFWNGNRSDPFDAALEDYVEIPSDNVPFEQRPWMKAAEITDEAIARLKASPDIKFARINYPNGDMVGHTGDIAAAIIAVEAVDLSLARLLDAIGKLGGAAIVTADHGNADQMVQIDKKTGGFVEDDRGRRVPMTAHTLNPVPCWIWAPTVQSSWTLTDLEPRRLSNLATTALALMGYAAPDALDPPLIRPA